MHRTNEQKNKEHGISNVEWKGIGNLEFGIG
jgi:hypothetical protein